MKRWLGAVAALLLLAGCGEPEPLPEPEPTRPGGALPYLCAAPSGAPTPCSPEQYTEQERRKALAADAKAVYKQLFAELAALQRGGGSATPSARLASLAGGPYLDAQQAGLAKLASLQAKLTGEVRLAKVAASDQGPTHGYDTAILACVDTRQAVIARGETVLSQGRLVAETVYFKRSGDVLKAWDAEQADPKSC